MPLTTMKALSPWLIIQLLIFTLYHCLHEWTLLADERYFTHLFMTPPSTVLADQEMGCKKMILFMLHVWRNSRGEAIKWVLVFDWKLLHKLWAWPLQNVNHFFSIKLKCKMSHLAVWMFDIILMRSTTHTHTHTYSSIQGVYGDSP